MNQLKIIIAGSRDYDDYELLRAEVNIILAPGILNRTFEIVSGSCRSGIHTFTRKDGLRVYGADGCGERWAEEYGYSVKPFPANWNKYGKSAYPIRNEEMAKYAYGLIAFWDGKSTGTKNMIDLAKKNNLKVAVLNPSNSGELDFSMSTNKTNIMKTAEETLNKIIDEFGFDYDSALIAMKTQAEHAIDRMVELTKLYDRQHDIKDFAEQVKKELKR